MSQSESFPVYNEISRSDADGEPGPLLGVHDVQLIMKNPSLQEEDAYGENPDNNQSASPSSDHSRPVGYLIGGIFFVFFGCVLAGYGATYGGNEKYQAGRYIIETFIAFGLIVVAAGIVAQGMRLIYLASTDRRAENIVVHPIIVPELKLCHVQRRIFCAADHATQVRDIRR